MLDRGHVRVAEPGEFEAVAAGLVGRVGPGVGLVLVLTVDGAGRDRLRRPR